MKKPLDKQKLARYRMELPHGGQKEVAKLAGVTRKSVCCFLNGEHQSRRIEFAVLEVIKSHKLELEKAQREAGLL